MKISTRVCDICGKPICQHARHTYELRKRFWEIGELGNRINWAQQQYNLCEECYKKFIVWLKAERKENV